MTLTLELTPAQEERLRREAAQRGQEPNDYARAVLFPGADEGLPAPAESDALPPGESLYDAIKDYVGMFESGGETNWSENTGEKFTEGLLEKKRQGRF